MINVALEKLDCGRLKNEALDIDMMHLKLNDITDKQFSLNQLSETKSTEREKFFNRRRLQNGFVILKLKSRLGIK
jgi:DNA polymerase-3 subunit epsilon